MLKLASDDFSVKYPLLDQLPKLKPFVTTLLARDCPRNCCLAVAELAGTPAARAAINRRSVR